VFAEQTRRSLQTVDIMLRAVADAYRDRTFRRWIRGDAR